MSGGGWTSQTHGLIAVISLEGDWLVSEASVDRGAARLVRGYAHLRGIGFDTAGLAHWDSTLLVFLVQLRQACAQCKIDFDQTGLPNTTRHLLGPLPARDLPTTAAICRSSIAQGVGVRVIGTWAEIIAATTHVGETTLATA